MKFEKTPKRTGQQIAIRDGLLPHPLGQPPSCRDQLASTSWIPDPLPLRSNLERIFKSVCSEGYGASKGDINTSLTPAWGELSL